MESGALGRCRVCLQHQDNILQLDNVVTVQDEEVSLSHILVSCCAVQILNDDKKPQTVCIQCAQDAENSFKFKRTVEQADLTLQYELDNMMDVKKEEIDEDITIQEDHNTANMVLIKDERTNGVSIPYNNNLKLKFEQDTISMEENVCKICQTHFAEFKSLEHHLESCYGRVCDVSEQTFTSDGSLNEHILTHEAPSTRKNVILKRRETSKYLKCRFCKMIYKFPAELRYHWMTHTTVKHYLCSYCGKNFSLYHRSKCERTHSQHSHKHISRKTNNKTSDSLKTQPRFGCSVCKKSYRRLYSWLNHSCKQSHKCSQCSKVFAFGSQLRLHARAHTSEKPYECSYCSERFNQICDLKVHKLTHAGGRPYKCLHCNRCFIKSSYLKRHIKSHTGEKPYECSYCNKRFNRKTVLTEHERIHTGEKPYECSHCNKRFNRLYHLKCHERAHTGEKPYECSNCSKRFNIKTLLIIHERTHTGEKPYGCSYCNKRFNQVQHRNSHERIHTGEKPYECSNCSKRFCRVSNLNRHKLTHLGDKPYECTNCNKRLAKHSHLIKHQRIHTGEKCYECSHCSKRFLYQHDLNRHERTHTGEKPYECSHCSKRFTRLSYLKSHERIHTGEKPYECSLCSGRFTTSSDLTKHKKRRHVEGSH